MCPRALSGRQERCCSGDCQRAYARSFPRPFRDQRGEKNGNFRGWRSRHPTLYTKPYKLQNPEKVRAHRVLNQAILAGRIVRPKFCDSCFVDCLPDGHHDDYSLPLSVQWLCRKCHIARHRILRLEQSLETLPEYEQWRRERDQLDKATEPMAQLASPAVPLLGGSVNAPVLRSDEVIPQFGVGLHAPQSVAPDGLLGSPQSVERTEREC